MEYPQINDAMIFVYELPNQLSNGFCFGAGKPITFTNVDWFNGFDGMTEEMVRAEVDTKLYIKPGKTYLVLSPENDMAFTHSKASPPQTQGGAG